MSRFRPLAIWVVCAGLVGLGVLVGSSPASAHAALIASSPSQGDHLDTLPAQVSFEFSEPMSDPAYVVVRGPDGASVTDGDPQIDGAVVTQALDVHSAQGTYTMAYRAVSEDGHPVTGEITFTVGAGDTSSSSAASAGQTSTPTTSTSPKATSGSTPGSMDAGHQMAGSDDGVGGGRRAWAFGVGAVLILAAAGLLWFSRKTDA